MPSLAIRPTAISSITFLAVAIGCEPATSPTPEAAEDSPTPGVVAESVPAPVATEADVPASPVPAWAVLAFDDPVVDFGRLADFEKRQAVVTFRNAGGEPLTITKVQPTCGCTSVGFDTSRAYAPGETGEIRLAFSPKGQGRQTKSVNVLSNDPDEPVRVITIKADIVPSLAAQPRVLQLGRVPFGEPFRTGTTVTALRPGIRLDRVTVGGDLRNQIEATIAPAGLDSAGRETWWVDVALDDTIPWGWRTGSLVVSGTAEAEAGTKPLSMNFAINGSFEGLVRADDSMFRLLAMEKNEAVEKAVVLERTDGEPFVCRVGTPTGDRTQSFAGEATPLDSEGRRWRITLRGTAPATAGSVIGRLPVTTDVPGEETLSLRIGGVVQR